MHFAFAGSWWHSISWLWLQSGIVFDTRVVHFPQSVPKWHLFVHVWPMSHVSFRHTFLQTYSRCSISFGWHTLSQICPQSKMYEHGLRQPPSGACLKSAASFTWMNVFGWFWQHNVKVSLKCSLVSASWMTFCHNELFPFIKSKLPVAYNPCFALERATHMRFSILKNPILSSSLLRTRDNKMMSFSSPWKLSIAATLTPSYKFLGISCFNWIIWPE